MDINMGQIIMFALIAFYVAQAWDGHTRHQAMLTKRKEKMLQKDK